MSEGERDPKGKGGLDTEHIKASLGKKTYDQLAQELSQRLSRENMGGEAEELADLYLEIMGEKRPPCPEVDPAEELAEFHRRLAAQTPPEEGPEKHPPRKVRRISPRRLMTAAILVVLALVLGGYATGFQWPKFLVSWKDEVLFIESTESGVMELEDAPSDSYRSLREAMDAYNLPHVEPKWIPEDFSIEEVLVSEFSERLEILAVYSAAEDLRFFIRIFLSEGTPNIGYEQDEDGKRKTVTIAGVEFQQTKNYDQNRITWIMDDCYCSVVGNVTEEQLERMAQSIFKE